MLYATVRQRKIHVKNPDVVIQNGVNVDDLVLEMDDEWASMDTIVAVFTLKYIDDGEKEIAKEILHTFGKPLRVPWECVSKTGRLTVSCTGYIERQKVMTTMYPDSFWEVVRSGPVTGDTPLEPTPTLYEQIMDAYAKANAAAENAENVSEQLMQDKANGVFDGEPGPQGEQGLKGDRGERGLQGIPGRDGRTPQVKITSVTSVVPGSNNISRKHVKIQVITQNEDGTASVEFGEVWDGVGVAAISKRTTDGNEALCFTLTDGSQKIVPFPSGDGGGGSGEPGADGITPHIGANGNWYIGETDTGVKAQGEDGVGITDIQKRTAAGREVLYITLSDGTEKGFALPVPENGKDYVLTDADKAEIAEQAAQLVDVPGGGGFVASTEPPADTNLLWVDTDDNSGNDGGITDDHINALIDAKLGVIENGTY